MKMKFRDKVKQEKGAIVIEATIALTAFMFLIFTILSIVNIVTLQTKIGIALNATAKEISQYSYLYTMTGINEKQAEIHEGSAWSTEQMDNVLKGMEGVIGSIDSLGETAGDIVGDVGGSAGDFGSIKEDIDNGIGSIDEIGTAVEEIAKNPKAFILGVGSLVANEGIEIFKNKAIVTPLVTGFIQKHLKDSSDQSAENYLKSKGVDQTNLNDLGGLDFEESVLFHNGTSEIVLIADYEVHVIELLNIDINLRFKQKALTRGWQASDLDNGKGDGEAGGEAESESGSEEESESGSEEESESGSEEESESGSEEESESSSEAESKEESEEESEEETEEPDEIVYVTESGNKYHTNEDCRHIKIAVITSILEDIDKEQYSICEKCGDEAQGKNVYVTEGGERYHFTKGCIKPTIEAISIEDVDKKTLCLTCKKKSS